MESSPIQFDEAKIRANTPSVLMERRQWVTWKYVIRRGKQTKQPIDPHTGNAASSIDPETWAAFDEAIAACRSSSRLDGIGFVFSSDDPYSGVDLDRCVDTATGRLKPWGQRIVASLNSYAEISPSGAGIKVFLEASKPEGRCRRAYEDGEVEIYDRGRYFTVTGHRLLDVSGRVESRQDELTQFWAEVFGQATPPLSAEEPERDPSAASLAETALTDEQILQKAHRSRKSGGKFSALWSGQWHGHFKSASEADSSVIFTLAFYTKDAAQIDRMFRTSGLMRPKWDEQHGAKTYGQMTIDNALAHVTDQYGAKGHRNSNGRKAIRKLKPLIEGSRPQIQGNERQLRDIRADALQALIAANAPPRLFRRGDGIARVALLQQDDKTATPSIQQLDANALRGEMSDAADWFTLKHTKQGRQSRP